MATIDLNSIRLQVFAKGRGKMYSGIGFTDIKYDVIANINGKDKKIGVVETNDFDNGIHYIANLKIDARLRGQGIGTALLRKYFRGYYLYNGNDRVRSLYERLGKPQSKFSQKESKQFLNAFSGTGLWKLK